MVSFFIENQHVTAAFIHYAMNLQPRVSGSMNMRCTTQREETNNQITENYANYKIKLVLCTFEPGYK